MFFAQSAAHHAIHVLNTNQSSRTHLGESKMNAQELLNEIREANLTYLMLAQALIRKDRAQALFRLGLSEAVADVIGRLTSAQILKIAATNILMCRFRFDDEVVWNLLTASGRERNGGAANDSASAMHAAILMSGQLAEAA